MEKCTIYGLYFYWNDEHNYIRVKKNKRISSSLFCFDLSEKNLLVFIFLSFQTTTSYLKTFNKLFSDESLYQRYFTKHITVASVISVQKKIFCRQFCSQQVNKDFLKHKNETYYIKPEN